MARRHSNDGRLYRIFLSPFDLIEVRTVIRKELICAVHLLLASAQLLGGLECQVLH